MVFTLNHCHKAMKNLPHHKSLAQVYTLNYRHKRHEGQSMYSILCERLSTYCIMIEVVWVCPSSRLQRHAASWGGSGSCHAGKNSCHTLHRQRWSCLHTFCGVGTLSACVWTPARSCGSREAIGRPVSPGNPLELNAREKQILGWLI